VPSPQAADSTLADTDLSGYDAALGAVSVIGGRRVLCPAWACPSCGRVAWSRRALSVAENVRVSADPASLARDAADHIADAARRAVAQRGVFSLCLSGGDTPAGTYVELATGHRSIPWEHVHVFWGDERCIPRERRDNHHTMAQRLMLSCVPIPASNVHRARGEAADPAVAAAEYEATLRGFFGDPAVLPTFDLVLLGMGEDGHVASLFPGSPGLSERTRWVVDHDIVKRGEPAHRLTLTVPALAVAREVMLLVAGELKAQMLADVLEHGADVPAREVTKRCSEVVWMVDREAAGALGSPGSPVGMHSR
jgi:6-phosphogluconolactonase